MTVEIKSTNLSLLRKIIEGKFDEIIDSVNVVITNEGVIKSSDSKFNDLQVLSEINENKNEKKEKKNKFNRRRILDKRKRNLEFYLEGDSSIIRDWLRTKKLESEKRKTDRRKQKKEERLKCVIEKEDKLNRELLARDAYDQWLKDNRKIQKLNISTKKDSISKTSISNNLEAPNTWLKKKENRKLKSSEVIGVTSKEYQDDTKKTINCDSIEKIKQIKQSKHNFVYSTKDSDVKKLITFEKSNDNDENMMNIIKDLRKKRNSENESSKRRVNSGIFMKREKLVKNELKIEPEEFLWKLISNDNEISDKDNKKRRSDSRSRQVDKISHHHLNPFVKVEFIQI